MNLKLFKSMSLTLVVFLLVHFLGLLPLLYSRENPGEKYPQAKNYTVQKAVSRIKIDGVLDEEAWKYPEKIELPFEWMPGDNIPAPVRTECLVTYDQSKFYVAFRCFDPEPGEIRAHFMDRDSIDTFIQDDYVCFVIDTFNDQRRAFEFRVNALGVQVDGVLSELEGYEDFSWDTIWAAVGRITSFGYVVEAAIPFNQLRFPKGKGVQTWGFEANRSYPRIDRHRLISHVRDRNKSCLLCQMNKLTGFSGISPGKNLEFDPTITASRTDVFYLTPSEESDPGKIKPEPGITAHWGISPNLTLNAAVNPDFSQVEADAAQLEVNTRFALRYPEKRPFFLEGADFFVTRLEAVFTRTIYDPLWGAKITGKSGKNALGLFVTQDRYNNLLFPSNQGSAVFSQESDVFGGVFRYRRDVGKSSTLGLLYAGRAAEDYYNHAAGVDGFFHLSKSSTLSFQYLHSRTDYPDTTAQAFNQDRDPFNGDALSAFFLHRSRHLIFHLKYETLSPGFRADSGFIPRVDTKEMEIKINPILWGKEGSWFDRIGVMVLANNITDFNNNLTDRMVLLAASYTGPLQTYFETDFTLQKEFFNGITYDLNWLAFYLEMKPTRGIGYSIYTTFGDTIDYSNSRPAKSKLLMPNLEFNIGKHLNLNISYIFEHLSLRDEKIYSANILQTRFVYNLNVRTFVRAIFQYTHIDRNTDLYLSAVDPVTKTLFTQFLFSYKINPRTVLFIGYSDNHLGMKGYDLTRTDRTFFLKIGYALVL
jgi:hypothetical protein